MVASYAENKLKVHGNGTFAAVANHSFLSLRGLAAVHLANRSCSAHNLVLDCDNYFHAFFQSICVYQSFQEVVKWTPSIFKSINIQAFNKRISELAFTLYLVTNFSSLIGLVGLTDHTA